MTVNGDTFERPAQSDRATNADRPTDAAGATPNARATADRATADRATADRATGNNRATEGGQATESDPVVCVSSGTLAVR
ncbi:hypothetical protein AB0F59_16380 [Micromonospora lupini]|uniref:hypothetical protein n=1 Tax=Micromonospora lupini TaxID=285679 RepID=UPI0033CCA397